MLSKQCVRFVRLTSVAVLLPLLASAAAAAASAGQLVETELAFFAQDDDGNVWNLGEYPEEYENGEFVGAPSTWIAGLAGAEAGVHMLAEPRQGTGYYLQGW